MTSFQKLVYKVCKRAVFTKVFFNILKLLETFVFLFLS